MNVYLMLRQLLEIVTQSFRKDQGVEEALRVETRPLEEATQVPRPCRPPQLRDLAMAA